MQKFVSLILCFTMAFGMIASASTQSGLSENSALDLIEVKINPEAKVVKEVSVCKTNGTIYYFESTDKYVLTMDMDREGTLNVYVRDVKEEVTVINDNENPQIFYRGSFQLKDKHTIGKRIDYLNKFADNIDENKTMLEEHSLKELGVTFYKTNTSRTTITSNIVVMLENLLGPEQSSTFVYSEDYREEHGQLYYSKLYSSGLRISFSLILGTSITAVSLATGFPPGTILGGLLILFDLVGGVYQVITAANAYEYYALVTHKKEGRVNNQEWHASTKEEYRYVLAYNANNMTDFKDGSSVSYTSKNSDYDSSNSYHVRKAIDNYLYNQS